VVGCGTLWLRTINIQLIIGRLVHLSKTQSYLVELRKELHEECIGISKLLINCILSLPLLLTISWSWFLFDIWGDVVGYYPGVLIFFGLPTVAVIILPLLTDYQQGKLRCWKKVISSKEMTKSESTNSVMVATNSNSESVWRLTHESDRSYTGRETQNSIVELPKIYYNNKPISFSEPVNVILADETISRLHENN
jgi:hypothetical protein